MEGEVVSAKQRLWRGDDKCVSLLLGPPRPLGPSEGQSPPGPLCARPLPFRASPLTTRTPSPTVPATSDYRPNRAFTLRRPTLSALPTLPVPHYGLLPLPGRAVHRLSVSSRGSPTTHSTATSDLSPTSVPRRSLAFSCRTLPGTLEVPWRGGRTWWALLSPSPAYSSGFMSTVPSSFTLWDLLVPLLHHWLPLPTFGSAPTLRLRGGPGGRTLAVHDKR